MLQRRDHAAMSPGALGRALARRARAGCRASAPAVVALALVAALAAACAEPTEVAAAPRGSGAIAANDEAREAGGLARTAGKPVAPFSVDHELLAAPAVGVPLEVRITVRPQVPMSALELEAVGDSTLEVAGADAQQSAPSAAAGAPAVWSVTVVPRDEGALQLKITIDGVIDGVRQARSVVVPIRVGAAGPGKGGPTTEAVPKSNRDAAAPSPAGDDGQDRGDGLIHLHSDE
ncbi:MAG TPA: hypothetical protein VFV10_11240 [Gammaproteobacteria bacterium]|nr:hypothetical protein [Gammaproteobacteria bacterium]